MKDVTETFQHYRLSLRDLWHRYIWSDPEIRHLSNIPGIFEKIKCLLFEALVLEKLSIEDERLATEKSWFGRFHIIPNVPHMQEGYCSAKLLLLQIRSDGGINNDGELTVHSTDVVLLFVDYFDLGNMDYSDLRYVQVRIHEFLARPELAGRDALIDARSATFMLSS